MARLSKDQRNQVIGVLNVGSTVNDQTIHNLMNWYNSTGSVRVHARPVRARMTTIRPYHVNTLTPTSATIITWRLWGSCT